MCIKSEFKEIILKLTTNGQSDLDFIDVNRKPLSLCPFVASFNTISTRFFMFFHMYIAPGRGRQTPVVKILMSTERPYHFDHLLIVLKKSL